MRFRLLSVLSVCLTSAALFALANAISDSISVRLKYYSKSKPGAYRVKVKYPTLYSKSPEVEKLAQLASGRIKSDVDRQTAKFLKEFQAGPPADSNGAAYEQVIDFETGVLTSRIASVMLTTYEYTGGAHGNTAYVFHNFGMVNAKPATINLAHLFRTRINPVPIVSKLVMGKLSKMDGADWVKEGEVKALTPAQAEQFRIVPKGLQFVFEPYALGPYAAGTFRVLVTWNELAPHLDRQGVLKGLF